MADRDSAPPGAGPLVSGSEIARLAGVTRAAVSNWRRRYDDFPMPAENGRKGALFALADVEAWLDRQRKGQEVSGEVRLWQALRAAYGASMVRGLADVAEHLAGTDKPSGLPVEAEHLVDDLARADSPATVITGLIERLVDSVRRTGSDQVTSPRIVRAVAHFAGEVSPDATVFDPACGIGSLLLAVQPSKGLKRLGQDSDPDRARLTRLRAALTGHTDVSIAVGDSLREDAWGQTRADIVVCDPPAGVTDWGRESLLLDSRWELGTPPRAEGELAWLQHAYAHTAPGGRLLAVMPASAAYRKAGRRIRAELVRRGLLVQVVALPSGVATSHALPVHLWELRRPDAAGEPVASVRLVDLTANSPDGPLDATAAQVAEVPLVDLLDDVVDVTPDRHLTPTPRDYTAEYATLRRRLQQHLEELGALLPDLSPGAEAGALDRSTVSVGELARAGLVEYGDAEPTSTSDQLDTDFLRGFLRSRANVRRSTSASGTYRLDGRGARIPQLDVEEQRRYGKAFRALEEFEQRMRAVAELGREAAGLAQDGLNNGALTPTAADDGAR
ncbi:N-6 DNA methylase [Streptomyces sp. TRM70308]|uniref:N-6 DNA methylase n=1 Tax=Streptomyces sp. TRM70308 TaxID=3131932 RepID=UPI003D01B858